MKYSIKKRPQVIHDLIEIATYIGENNLNASDQFLIAAESTINQLANYPLMGKQLKVIVGWAVSVNLILFNRVSIKGTHPTS